MRSAELGAGGLNSDNLQYIAANILVSELHCFNDRGCAGYVLVTSVAEEVVRNDSVQCIRDLLKQFGVFRVLAVNVELAVGRQLTRDAKAVKYDRFLVTQY